MGYAIDVSGGHDGHPSIGPEMSWKEVMSRLKTYMRDNHVPVVGIAKKMDIRAQRLRNWLNGLYPPTIAEFVQLCNLLNVNPCRFIPGSEEFSAKGTNLYDLLETLVHEAMKKTMAERAVSVRLVPASE